MSSRALAIVHLAMYDAYAGLAADPKNFPLYVAPPPTKSIPLNDATVAAAVAAAAFKTLNELYPSQAPFFQAVFDGAGAGPNATGDVKDADAYGMIAGQAIWDDRKGDPGAGGNYKPSLKPGKHRPDPDNPSQGFHAPEYGSKARGFGITERFELAPPPFQTGGGKFVPAYLNALKQVRGLGITPELAGMLPKGFPIRTPDNTVIGVYWGYDGALEIGTPPRLYNQIVRRVAIQQNSSVGDKARLFAFVNVAMADAGILAWEQKYIHNFWRPVVGIREHDPSLGPDPNNPPSNPILDEGDTAWLPLGAPNTNKVGAKNFTPPFPAYPSGHATFGAAAFHITRLFYNKGGRFNQGKGKPGKDPLFNGLDFVSDEYNGISLDIRGTVRPKHRRKFPNGLWDMILENGLSRVYLGVHWVFDAFAVDKDGAPDLGQKTDKKFIGGVPLGLLIAEDVFDAGKGRAPKYSNVQPLTPVAAEDGAETFSSTYQPGAQAR